MFPSNYLTFSSNYIFHPIIQQFLIQLFKEFFFPLIWLFFHRSIKLISSSDHQMIFSSFNHPTKFFHPSISRFFHPTIELFSFEHPKKKNRSTIQQFDIFFIHPNIKLLFFHSTLELFSSFQHYFFIFFWIQQCDDFSSNHLALFFLQPSNYVFSSKHLMMCFIQPIELFSSFNHATIFSSSHLMIFSSNRATL
jgi:hypothetical protein